MTSDCLPHQVRSWEGIDLGWFNTLQDTTSMVFTKQYGFRFSSCHYRELAARQAVLHVDFAYDVVGLWRGEMRQRVQATKSGKVHAILASWEVYDSSPVAGAAALAACAASGADSSSSSGGGGGGGVGGGSLPPAPPRAPTRPLVATMSTHPDATLDNFPRDMQWGQGLQLIEDLSQAAAGMAPAPFVVTEGEWLILVTRYSADGVTLQFQLERDIPRAD
jgi:type III protein arginine methyltransferase